MRFMQETWHFARTHKRYWVVPILLVLTGLAALAIFGDSAVGIPSLYTLF